MRPSLVQQPTKLDAATGAYEQPQDCVDCERENMKLLAVGYLWSAALRCFKPGSFVIVRGWGCIGQAGLHASGGTDGMLCEPAGLFFVPSTPPLMGYKAFPGSGRVPARCMCAEYDISAFHHRLAVSP